MQDRHRGELPFNRRIFLKSGIIFGGAALAGVGLLHGAEAEKKGDEQEAEVGPPEDLMREHGVLKQRSVAPPRCERGSSARSFG